MPHIVATLIYLSQMYSYYIRGDMSHLKHTTTLFSLSDHYILSREWIVIVDQVQTIIMVGLMYFNQSGVSELLIMRDPHYVQMCFTSVKTLGVLHS